MCQPEAGLPTQGTRARSPPIRTTSPAKTLQLGTATRRAGRTADAHRLSQRRSAYAHDDSVPTEDSYLHLRSTRRMTLILPMRRDCDRVKSRLRTDVSCSVRERCNFKLTHYPTRSALDMWKNPRRQGPWRVIGPRACVGLKPRSGNAFSAGDPQPLHKGESVPHSLCKTGDSLRSPSRKTVLASTLLGESNAVDHPGYRRAAMEEFGGVVSIEPARVPATRLSGLADGCRRCARLVDGLLSSTRRKSARSAVGYLRVQPPSRRRARLPAWHRRRGGACHVGIPTDRHR